MKLIWRLLASVAGVGLLVLVTAYLAGVFSSKIAPEQSTNRQRQTPDGKVIQVRIVEEPVIEQATGTVHARNETVVSSRITGSITTVTVRAGDTIKVGEPLLTLDNRELQARLAQQQQAARAAAAWLAEAEPSYDRVKALFDRGSAARAELDRAQTELRSAQAELGRARRSTEAAEAAMSYSVITAPLTGRVSDRFADPGDMAIPGSPLLRLYDPETLRLEANVRESLATGLKLGREVAVRIDALDQTYPATVDEIVPAADPGSRSFLIKAALPTGAVLYPGMFGRLLIPSGTTERFYLPKQAVSRVGQLEFVLVASDTGAIRRFVRIGRENDASQVEVLSGLTPNERVLLPTDQASAN